jgi:glycine/D-amino acid oxidase-like deaminating enzyme
MTGPAGALWPYRFVGGVTSHLADAERYPNLTLEANTPIESIVPSGLSEHPFRVRTRRGEIDAQYIIHCTNGHAGHLLPGLRGKVYPMRGQMTRQSAPAAFPRLGDQRSWILHYSPGYDYMTQAPSPSGDIYIGGGLLRALLSRDTPLEDADVGNVRDDQQSPGALKALETVIEERFRDGNGTAILDTWTGVMGFTVDDAPIIGKVPPSISGRDVGLSNGGEWVAAGFCGHGMAYCWLTGKAVADMLLKGQDSVKGWFPTEQYACSKERFQNSNLVEALAAFLETVA